MSTHFEQKTKFTQKRREGMTTKEREVRVVYEREGAPGDGGVLLGIVFEEEVEDTLGAKAWKPFAKIDAPAKGKVGDGPLPKGVGTKILFDLISKLSRIELAET